MLKTKDGYSKVVGTTYQGSSNHLLLSNGGVKSISDFALSNHTHSYLPLAGGTMNDNARISTNGDLYIGNPDNNGWLYLQDIASQDGDDFWSITTAGVAEFESISIRDNINVTANAYIGGQITREGKNGSWVAGRAYALLRDTTSIGYHPLWSLKTKNGSWEFGEYNSTNWYDVPVLSYITDTDYAANNNQITYQQKFQLDSGTIALTKNIPNPTNYYWADIKVSANSSTTTSPTFSNVTAHYYKLQENGNAKHNLAYLSGSTIFMCDENTTFRIDAHDIIIKANYNECMNINTLGHVGIGKTASQSATLTVNGITELNNLKLLVSTMYRYQPICVACGKVTDNTTSVTVTSQSSLGISVTYVSGYYKIYLNGLDTTSAHYSGIEHTYAQVTPINKYTYCRAEIIKEGNTSIYLKVYCNVRTSFYFSVWTY